MKRIVLLIVFGVLNSFLMAQNIDMRAFALFDSSGTEINYDHLISTCSEHDVILFGEHHNSAVMHWIQLRVLKHLAEGSRKVQLGAEFFERDDQLIIDEYLAGLHDEKKLVSETKEWSNFETDYQPILEYAKEKDIPFYATNVPRRYASIVAKKGIDSLNEVSSKESKALYVKLPFDFNYNIPGYSDIRDMMGGHSGGTSSDNFVLAQAIKDATMAESILENKEKDAIFLHINGDFHSANYGGIYWYLKNADKDLRVMTIKVFESENLEFKDDWHSSGDIILIVPEDFTKTH